MLDINALHNCVIKITYYIFSTNITFSQPFHMNHIRTMIKGTPITVISLLALSMVVGIPSGQRP